MRDQIQSFIFEDQPVRGSIVQLDAVVETILSKKAYPAPIAKLLGETLVAVSLLFAISKQEGKMTLQFQGEGLVRLLSARCTHKHQLRALAKWDGDVPEGISYVEALGEGQLVMTYQPDKGSEVFQSVIPLSGESISDTMKAYFLNSEQLKTHLQITADAGRAAGFFLQILPDEPYKQEVSFEHAVTLASTLKTEELLDVSPLELIKRLYHEDDVRAFEPLPLQFGCTCSVSRMENAIVTMGQSEALKILAEHESIEVTCDFCGDHYDFDRNQVEGLF